MTADSGVKQEHGWDVWWLIEKRGLPRAQWLKADGDWTLHANEALWFARKGDAEKHRIAAGHDFVRIVVCDHAFATDFDALSTTLARVTAERDELQAQRRDWLDNNVTARTLVAQERELATLTARLAAAEGQWVPWKPGDIVPDVGPMERRLTTVCGRGYRGPFVSWQRVEEFKEADVFAYWSAPLPPPYTALQPSAGK